ncbi:hypothetical protein M5K25_013840 [Dendrobium thyrsiflorum]|uniref:Uncharacterized protein n=1 Tax=Dendrobium thyrsiflorum TaxID=117978 RepID=A0ABD0UU18_DENTH
MERSWISSTTKFSVAAMQIQNDVSVVKFDEVLGLVVGVQYSSSSSPPPLSYIRACRLKSSSGKVLSEMSTIRQRNPAKHLINHIEGRIRRRRKPRPPIRFFPLRSPGRQEPHPLPLPLPPPKGPSSPSPPSKKPSSPPSSVALRRRMRRIRRTRARGTAAGGRKGSDRTAARGREEESTVSIADADIARTESVAGMREWSRVMCLEKSTPSPKITAENSISLPVRCGGVSLSLSLSPHTTPHPQRRLKRSRHGSLNLDGKQMRNLETENGEKLMGKRNIAVWAPVITGQSENITGRLSDPTGTDVRGTPHVESTCLTLTVTSAILPTRYLRLHNL